jgi:hypothetical protein
MPQLNLLRLSKVQNIKRFSPVGCYEFAEKSKKSLYIPHLIILIYTDVMNAGFALWYGCQLLEQCRISVAVCRAAKTCRYDSTAVFRII